MSPIWAIVLAFVLVGVNAFFVSVEFALISSRRDRLENMIANGNRRAAKVRYATEHLTIMLAGAQFGITLASVVLGKVGEPAIAHLIEVPFDALGLPPHLLHPISFAIALLIVTVLHIILGEMVPKNIALAGPESVATRLVGVHLLFVKLTHPIMVALNWIARVTLSLLGVEQKDELDSTVSPSELASMIAESRSEGLIAPDEASRLSKALSSSRRAMHEVLIPSDKVRCLHYGSNGPSVADVEQAVVETGYSRFPVADADGTWVGYVHVKDVLDNLVAASTDKSQRKIFSARPVHAPRVSIPATTDSDPVMLDAADVRPMITVDYTDSFDIAMRKMRKNSSHVATVLNNGQVMGIVTLEDIIEELIGTVRDWTHDD